MSDQLQRHYSDTLAFAPRKPSRLGPGKQARGTMSLPSSPVLGARDSAQQEEPWAGQPHSAQPFLTQLDETQPWYTPQAFSSTGTYPLSLEDFSDETSPSTYSSQPYPDQNPHASARRCSTVDSEGFGPMRKKRAQVRIACTHCQKACKKCSNTRPCERCVKYGLQDCVDSTRKPRKSGLKRGPYKRRSSRYEGHTNYFSASPQPYSLRGYNAHPGQDHVSPPGHGPNFNRNSRDQVGSYGSSVHIQGRGRDMPRSGAVHQDIHQVIHRPEWNRQDVRGHIQVANIHGHHPGKIPPNYRPPGYHHPQPSGPEAHRDHQQNPGRVLPRGYSARNDRATQHLNPAAHSPAFPESHPSAQYAYLHRPSSPPPAPPGPKTAALHGAFISALHGPRWVHGQRLDTGYDMDVPGGEPVRRPSFPVSLRGDVDPFSRAVSPIRGDLDHALKGLQAGAAGVSRSVGFMDGPAEGVTDEVNRHVSDLLNSVGWQEQNRMVDGHNCVDGQTRSESGLAVAAGLAGINEQTWDGFPTDRNEDANSQGTDPERLGGADNLDIFDFSKQTDTFTPAADLTDPGIRKQIGTEVQTAEEPSADYQPMNIDPLSPHEAITFQDPFAVTSMPLFTPDGPASNADDGSTHQVPWPLQAFSAPTSPASLHADLPPPHRPLSAAPLLKHSATHPLGFPFTQFPHAQHVGSLRTAPHPLSIVSSSLHSSDPCHPSHLSQTSHAAHVDQADHIDHPDLPPQSQYNLDSPALIPLERIRKPSLRTLMSRGGSLANSRQTSPVSSTGFSEGLRGLAGHVMQSPTLFDEAMSLDEAL